MTKLTLTAAMSPNEYIYDQLATLTVRFINLQASLHHGHPIKDTLASLLRLDNDLSAWISDLPASWHYKQIPCRPDDNFYGGSCHIHPSYWTAAVWAEYCTIRVLVCDLSLTLLDKILPMATYDESLSFGRQQRILVRTVRSICTDICDSVPFFLGRVSDSPTVNSSLGGYYFICSLFICAYMWCNPTSQRL